MRKLILLFGALAFSLAFVACDDDDHDRRIDFSEVPVVAQGFVAEHFGVDDVRSSSESHSRGYEVRLKDGTEIEFDSNGAWRKVDMNRNSLPQSVALLINSGILDYVATHYPNVEIEELERRGGRIFVELRNDRDLVFEQNGDIVIDFGGGGSTVITLGELPVSAREFLTTHFANIAVAKAKKDAKEYEVELINGTEIEFDLQGGFKSVEVETGTIPEGIMMAEIVSYVKESYSGRVIEEYSKLSAYYVDEYAGGYKVELSGSPEIKLFFSKTGDFLKRVND